MTLENLLSVGRLKPHKATGTEIRRLLASAEAALADARRMQNSAATRFDMGYKAIMQCALAALMANGFRPSTNEPGHQQTTIQTLPKTIGLPADRMKILDSFRRARNLSDDPVRAGSSEGECSKGVFRVGRKFLAVLLQCYSEKRL